MVKRCTVLDDYQNVVLSMADWSPLAGEVETMTFNHHITDEEALVEALKDSEIVGLIRERTPMTASLFARLPKLELIVTAGGPNTLIDMAAAEAHGVTVCGTAGTAPSRPGFYNATAELAFGHILALARNIPAEDANVRAGGWMTTVGHGLYGKTLGILGLGRLGAVICGFGKAFGMEPIAWSSSLTEARCREVGARLVDKETLFREADFLTIHMLLSDRSRGLVTASDLALMKPTLREKRIAGAGLDVYDTEPLPADHPLRSLPNTVLTPHLGFVVRDTYAGFFNGFVMLIRAWLDGAPIGVLT
jgi:phosphoglycerate dehydrogenase-like enzyme